jgi:L-seryl-tRNA(Ser) seleniumtransferase
MPEKEIMDIYQELGIRKIVNAVGTATVVGGAVLSPRVQEAMDHASQAYAGMDEVVTKAGEAIASDLGAESAFVTAGCFAALALSAAAVMTGPDDDLIAQLPDTTGLKDEFLIQNRHRYHYDRSVQVPGGKLVEVGDENGVTRSQFEGAIGSSTAGVLYPAHMDGEEGTLSLSEVISIAQSRGIAVIVDAAFQVFPIQRMKDIANCGADSICFSLKYMGGPNSVGFMVGKKSLVDSARLHGFTAFELEDNRALGRGYKVDRGETVAAVAAMREWFTLDHDERIRDQERRFQVLVELLGDIPNVTLQQGWFGQIPWMQLRVVLDEEALGMTVDQASDALKALEPSIWTRPDGDALSVAVITLNPGEEQLVAHGLRQVLIH